MRLLCGVLLGAMVCAASFSAVALEAGAGKAEITPPVGTPLNGYGARFGRGSVGVHDPLTARAIYLSDGETALFLVNADLCMINRELRARVLELVPQVVPPEHVILTATHTHSAQGGMCRNQPLRFVAGAYSQAVLDATATGIVEAMRRAYESRQRASIGFGTGTQQNLSANRRVPGGPIDPQIGVLLVENADGAAIAAATNFAAHPTSVPDEDLYLISADYCGFYYAEMETLLGEGSVALFLNGAEGNQTIADPEGHSGWARTESVGRLLARRAMAIAGGIDCGDAALRVMQKEARLPLTLASAFMPSSTMLTTLEINDLLMCFWPGEPVVELGLGLRERALTLGYKALFNVGLANDYLMYFVTRDLYAKFNYEAAQNYYGPGMQEWFYRHFETLMSKGRLEEEGGAVPPALLEQRGGITLITVRGDGYTRGRQRGQALGEMIRTSYEQQIVQPISRGDLLPPSSLWSMAPGFIDVTPFALPILATGARELLAGIEEERWREMEGMAEGAALPFDAVWLRQLAANLETAAGRSGLMRSPLCTLVAGLGEGTEGLGLVLGRTLDLAHDEETVVLVEYPEEGFSSISVGFCWNAGVFTGINERGLAVALARAPACDVFPVQGPPMEFVLRAALQHDATVAAAAARLAALRHLRGYQVLLAGPGEGGTEARLVVPGEKWEELRPADGLLLGLPALCPDAEDESQRYRRVATLLSGMERLGIAEMERVMTDTVGESGGRSRIWNGDTRHAVVMVPMSRTVFVAVPSDDGSPGRFEKFTLGGGAGE